MSNWTVNQPVINKSYEISGTMTIPNGSNVVIRDADLVFQQCAELVVQPSATLTIKRSDLRSCSGHWKGIRLQPTDAVLQMEAAFVKNANVGVKAVDASEVEVITSTFEKNIHHVLLMGAIHPTIVGKNDFGELTCQTSNRPCSGAPIPGQSWVQDCNMITIGPSSNRPTDSVIVRQNNFRGPTSVNPGLSNGLVAHGSEGVHSNQNHYFEDIGESGMDLTQMGNVESDQDDYDLSQNQTGITIRNSENVLIDENTFQYYSTGKKAMYGVEVRDNSSGPNTKNIKVNGNHFEKLKHGVYMKNVRNSVVDNNTLTNFDHGIEYYANQNYSKETVIRENKITGGTSSNEKGHGIVVSPAKDPVDARNAGGNTNGNVINLNIECNKLWYNKLGIVGSGDLVDQGTLNSPAGNNFDDQTGSSLNTEWDILWQYPVYNGGGGNAFDYYYYDYTGGHTPNDPSSVNRSGKLMNGQPSHSSEDFTKMNTPYQGCYAQKRNPNTSLKEEDPSSAKGDLAVYPNPFENQIQLERKEDNHAEVRVATMLGNQVYEDAFRGKTKTIATDNWSTGMYIIEVVAQQGNVIETRKVLKVD